MQINDSFHSLYDSVFRISLESIEASQLGSDFFIITKTVACVDMEQGIPGQCQ